MSDTASRNKEKRALLEDLLKSDYAFIHVAARTAGLVLPLNIIQDSIVTLKVSYHFERKMAVTESGVDAELSFGNKVSNCHIPWAAIWGMSSIDGKRLVWPDEIPAELSAPAPKTAKKRSSLESVKAGPQDDTASVASSSKQPKATHSSDSAETSPSDQSPPAPQAKRAKPSLKRIK